MQQIKHGLRGFEFYGFNFIQESLHARGLNALAIMWRMTFADRRQHANAPLRAKIDQIQASSDALVQAVAQVQQQTLSWVRESQATDLPNAELAHRLSALFKAQREAMAHIQQATVGVPAPAPQRVLITDDEMAALLKP